MTGNHSAWTRVGREHRRALVTLGAALVLNLLAYLFVVSPLSARVANVAGRNAAAARALAAARQEQAGAAGALEGKARAGRDLERFYTRVLPTGLPAARRLMQPRLAELAMAVKLGYSRASAEPQHERGSALARLQMELELDGAYAGVREFLHDLEIAPEFVVVDNVVLAQSSATETGLAIKMQLSTYYRAPYP